MGDGRRAKAPCGHLGEVVIGTYVQCLRCDKKAVPKYVPPEKTEPMYPPRCPGCGSIDIEQFEDALDAAFWHMSRPSPSGPPSTYDWGCHKCAKIFQKPI